MNHTDHVNLIRDVGIAVGETWADLGAGTGAFTLAIAELLGTSGTIYAVDRDGSALRQQSTSMRMGYPSITAHFVTADFTKTLTLPPLDGIIMANSLHFASDKDAILQRVKTYLKPSTRVVVVEYNTDHGNQWVPYPFSYPTWVKIASRNGFGNTRQIGSRPSRFLGEIYAAVSIVD